MAISRFLHFQPLAVIVALGLGYMIAACGQKGALYLPEPEQTPAQQTEVGTETDAKPEQG
ncbi:MAG: lipoprotein [Candidatus Thiosymbion ectosymbiont of Robbea hypermnestra]|nr:lipoprotein [Candidatus Thiosymbion ectosymbiont of Robbea hypermnestra]